MPVILGWNTGSYHLQPSKIWEESSALATIILGHQMQAMGGVSIASDCAGADVEVNTRPHAVFTLDGCARSSSTLLVSMVILLQLPTSLIQHRYAAIIGRLRLGTHLSVSA